MGFLFRRTRLSHKLLETGGAIGFAWMTMGWNGSYSGSVKLDFCLSLLSAYFFPFCIRFYTITSKILLCY